MPFAKPVLAFVAAVLTLLPFSPAIHHSSLVTRHLSPVTRHSQAIPDRRFGVIETFADPASASTIGAGWTRVRFPWADLQPNNDGEWNNAFFSDDMLAAELAAGREVVGLIVNTPFWALNDGATPGVPRGLYLPETDPGNVWATFVRQIVTRYAGRIDRWIIWNEPDIWDPSYPGRTWGGSVPEFFQLQRVAYHVAKQANPNAQVHLSAFTYYWDVNYGRTPFFSLLMDEIQKDPQAAAHNYYFDVASANLYFDPDNIYDLIAWHHGQMQARGFDKPIWLTETNAAPSSDPNWPVANPTFTISLDDQAAFVPIAFAMALAAGADRVGVYKMIDTADDRAANPEPFGLVRDDGSRRPAFTAFQVASNYLSGFSGATLDHRDDLYGQVTVHRGDVATTILWARAASSVQVQVPARSTQAVLADAFGGRQTIVPRDGVYTIDLPACTQPFCVTGGSPRLLVEGAPAVAVPPATTAPDPASAQPTLEPPDTPIVTLTPSPTASPTWTATPIPTTMPTATLTQTPTPTPTLDQTLTLPPPLPPSNTEALFATLGILSASLIVAYALARVSSTRASGEP